MIVVAILAILASMAVPNFLAAGATANEAATIATLRTMATAQFRFKSMAMVDRDFSGSYEYGTLPELAGMADVRQANERLSPGLLSASWGALDASGTVIRQGYHYALHLPDAAGVGILATPANEPNIDARNAEIAWTLLAWPTAYAQSGRSTFFVNQQGMILRSTTARYSGLSSPPPAGAALIGVAPQQIVGGRLASGGPGADGNTWVPVQ
jgi:hypothetical protein